MFSGGDKQSAGPVLGTVIAGAAFFGAGVVVCLILLLRGDSTFWLVIGGVGLAACGFMEVVSLLAIRNVLKDAR